MTTPEQARATEARTPEASGSLAIPIGLLIVAIVLGAASVGLTVFGVWPAAVLVILSAGLAAIALNRIKKHKPSATA